MPKGDFSQNQNRYQGQQRQFRFPSNNQQNINQNRNLNTPIQTQMPQPENRMMYPELNMRQLGTPQMGQIRAPIMSNPAFQQQQPQMPMMDQQFQFNPNLMTLLNDPMNRKFNI